MVDIETIPPGKTKWYKTRQCWCDDCRFYSLEERPECPAKTHEREGLWLWAMRPDMIGRKDYIDPLDFAPPPGSTERPEPVEGTDSESPTESST